MPIKIDCPRCSQSLSVPNKRTGGYVSCPRCNGRFWVPASGGVAGEGAAGSPAQEDKLIPAPPRPGANPASSGVTSGGVAPGNTPAIPRAGAAGSAVDGPPTTINRPPPIPPPAPPGAAPLRKTARFISAEAAQSSLKLAADGKLPELQLQQGDEKRAAETGSTTVNPLLLFAVLSFSAVASIALVLIDTDSHRAADSARKEAARWVIEDEYFANDDFLSDLDSDKRLEEYQTLLREAQQAHSRGNRKREREKYREVLNLLRAERGPLEKGLTGSRSRDKRLEQQIAVLLSEE